jgi:ribosomal protein S3
LIGLKRYRIVIQQQEQFQQNEKEDLKIDEIIEELYKNKKINRNNITKSELRDEIKMYRT